MTDAELPKYKYSYGCPIRLLNNRTHTGSQIIASNLTTDIPMIHLHDVREMYNIVKLRQSDTYRHIWNNPNLLRKPLTDVYVQDNYTIQGTDDVHTGLDDVRN